MEQGNRMNNHGGGKPPKMPRFNMSWLYVIILISLIVVFLNGGGDALGGSANKKATYTEFKEYIEKGYVLSVTANKNDGNLKVYVAPNHIRDVYHTSAKNVGPAPYVEVQYGSIDEVDKYLDNMVKAKKNQVLQLCQRERQRLHQPPDKLRPTHHLLPPHLVGIWKNGRWHGRLWRRYLQCRQEQSTHV